MRVALVSVHTAGALGPAPPMGLGYLAAALRQSGHEAIILDTGLLPGWRTRLADFGPELVGIGALSAGAHRIGRVAALAKGLFGCPVVVGGAHATLLPESVLAANPDVDFVLPGESERTLARLADSLSTQQSPERVPGLLYRDDGRPCRTAGAVPPPVLDELPFPAWDLLLPQAYGCAPVVASRGCPYGCVYCAVPILQGHAVRHRAAESIVEEMAVVASDYGVVRFELSGDAFMCNPAVVERVCHLILRRRLPVSWHVPGGRSDRLNLSLLRLMRQAGCHAVHLGIESGSDAVLRQMRKGVAAAAHRRAIALVHEAGMKVVANFIVGCPGETEATGQETVEFLDSIEADTVFVNLAVAYPRTELHGFVERFGRFLGDPSTSAPAQLPDGPAPRVSFETPELPASDRAQLQARIAAAGRRSEARAARARVLRATRALATADVETGHCTAPTGKPEIAVVIPTKDRPTYLDLTLASLVMQELDPRRYEIIVVDDGSSPSTGKVLRTWSAALPLRTVRHENSQGRAAARNSGLELCTAPTVLFLDDDCLCPPHLLLQHLKHQMNGATVVLGDISRVLHTHISGREAAEQVAADLRRFGIDERGIERQTVALASQGSVRTVSVEDIFCRLPEVVHRSTLGRLHIGPALELLAKAGVKHPMPWVHFVTRNASAPLAAVREAGAFDETYTGWGAEDADLGYRLYRLGVPFVYERDAFVIHQEHAVSPRQDAERAANVQRLLGKYPELDGTHERVLTGRAQAMMVDLAHEQSLGLPARRVESHSGRRPRGRAAAEVPPLLWFSRGVGYGHAVRDREILREIAALRPDLWVIVATSGAGLALLTGDESVDLGPWDRTNSYARVRRVHELIEDTSPALVVCDEEAEAAFAARRRGLGAIYITNWLLSPDVHAGSRALQDVDSVIFADHRAGAVTGGAWRAPVRYVGPILPALPEKREREAIRRELDIGPGAKVLTLAFGAGTEQDVGLVAWLLQVLTDHAPALQILLAPGQMSVPLASAAASFPSAHLAGDFCTARRWMLASDAVVTRGGHTTLWELAYAGIPCVAMPYGGSVNPMNRRYVRRMAQVSSVVEIPGSAERDAGLLCEAVDSALREETRADAVRRAAGWPPPAGARTAAEIIVSFLDTGRAPSCRVEQKSHSGAV